MGTNQDITERKRAEEALQLAALVYEHSSEAMMVSDAENRIIAINPAFTALTGYSAEEVVGKNPKLLKSGRQDADFYRAMWDALASQGHWQGEVWNRHKNGRLFAEELAINTIRHADGTVYRYVALFSDITEKKQAEALIWQQANFDSLTHLPNRRTFRDRLDQSLKTCRRNGTSLALLFIDLDRFKEVNDTLGHDNGDILLVEAARRIRACVRESDTVARLGGDEFTVALPELEDASRVQYIAQKIIDSLSEAFVLGQEKVFITASIGITLYPGDATEIEDLFKHADQALYVAKAEGRSRFSYFTPELQIAAQARMRLTNDLREALAQGQFNLHFQPVVEMATGQHPQGRGAHPLAASAARDSISPAQFIPLAEASGLIVDIGEWTFREAVRWVKRWRERGSWPFPGEHQPVSPGIPGPWPRLFGVGGASARGRPARHLRCGRDHRGAAARCEQGGDGEAARTSRRRHRGRLGRFRRRLFVAFLSQEPGHRLPQDRPVLHPQPGAGLERHGAVGGHHRHGAQAGAHGSSPKASRRSSSETSCARPGATWPRATFSRSRCPRRHSRNSWAIGPGRRREGSKVFPSCGHCRGNGRAIPLPGPRLE